MDSFTHALTGAVIARAIHDEKIGKWGTLTGLAIGLFPDSDFVLGLFDHQFSIQYHRDFTHSILLIPFYSLFFSWLLVKISKRPYFWSFYKICLPVLLSHVLLDLFTSYGTMILSPFFDHRFAWDLIFVIDLTLSAIITLPLLASFFLKRASPWICRGSLVMLFAYILFCWIQQGQALKVVRDFSGGVKGEVIQIAALPQPISPFRWALYVESEDNVYQGFVDLRRKVPPDPAGPQSSLLGRLNRLYYPPGSIPFQSMEKLPNSPWVTRALTAKGVEFYYWFARFPVVKSVRSQDGRHRVEFMDVRFYLPGIRQPFVYYVEMDDSGRVLSEGFKED
jgi:inner membrane protein